MYHTSPHYLTVNCIVSTLRILQIMHWSFAYICRYFYWIFMYVLLDSIYQDSTFHLSNHSRYCQTVIQSSHINLKVSSGWEFLFHNLEPDQQLVCHFCNFNNSDVQVAASLWLLIRLDLFMFTGHSIIFCKVLVQGSCSFLYRITFSY